MKVTKHKARKDLYKRGLKTPSSNKQGYSIDRTKPADPDDEVVVRSGQEYYSWHPKNRQHVYSLEPYVYKKPYNEWNDKFDDFNSRIKECEDRDELRSEIEEYRDELQERLDNIPEQLQESSILNERIEELDDLISTLDDL